MPLLPASAVLGACGPLKDSPTEKTSAATLSAVISGCSSRNTTSTGTIVLAHHRRQRCQRAEEAPEPVVDVLRDVASRAPRARERLAWHGH